jgi:hypothetical protein
VTFYCNIRIKNRSALTPKCQNFNIPFGKTILQEEEIKLAVFIKAALPG